MTDVRQSSPPSRLDDAAVVVIGRNEGLRLKACLRSVDDQAAMVVYVDSGSTDDSVAMARDLGVEIVELDLKLPFTAARARNEGISRLLSRMPDIRFIQFVDGDSQVEINWLQEARMRLRRWHKCQRRTRPSRSACSRMQRGKPMTSSVTD